MTAKKANVYGGSKDPARGAWCTPNPIARAVGRFDVDPFSNPRSHIESTHACMLENDGDGLLATRGAYRVGGAVRVCGEANEATRVWFQPPYGIVMRALDHYGHTRFAALLRFDPRTKWFRRLYRMVELVCVLRKCEFEPPPGIKIKGPANPFPHAIYYANAGDVTPAVLRLTAAAWRVR